MKFFLALTILLIGFGLTVAMKGFAQTDAPEPVGQVESEEAASAEGLTGLTTRLAGQIATDDPAELARRTVLSLAALALALLLRWLFRRFAARITRHFDASEQAADLENRVRRTIGALIVVGLVLALLEIWGLGLSELAPGGGGAFGKIAAVILIAWAVWHAARIGIEALLLRRTGGDEDAAPASQRARTLAPLLTGAAQIVILLVAGLIVLSEIGIDIAPLLAGAGILGLAVGFGAQSLVKDVLTGVFILFEDSIAVGDVVTVAGHSGLVEGMSLRELRLRDLRGTVHIVPYGEIGTIQNLTRDFSYALLDIGIAYQEDVDRVMAVMLEIAEEQRADPELSEIILEPMEMLGLNEFADSAVVIRGRVKTQPLQQWRVQRDYNLRLKRRFDAEGIEIPFPHRTLYFGADKEGAATAMRMRLLDSQAKSSGSQRETQDGREPSES